MIDSESSVFDAAEIAVERAKTFDRVCWAAISIFAAYFVVAVVSWIAHGAPVMGRNA